VQGVVIEKRKVAWMKNALDSRGELKHTHSGLYLLNASILQSKNRGLVPDFQKKRPPCGSPEFNTFYF